VAVLLFGSRGQTQTKFGDQFTALLSSLNNRIISGRHHTAQIFEI
jgi:hypothetical protein